MMPMSIKGREVIEVEEITEVMVTVEMVKVMVKVTQMVMVNVKVRVAIRVSTQTRHGPYCRSSRGRDREK